MAVKSGRPVIIRKIVKKREGHHGGSWKVAYADFVTAMMAFFLLLWLLSMVSQDRRAALSQYFKHFSVFKESGQSFMKGSPTQVFDKGSAEMKRSPGGGRDDRLSPEKLQQQIRAAVEEKLSALENQVMVDVSGDDVKIQIVDTEGSLMFQRGSAQLTEKAKQILKLVAENIKNTGNRIVVEGHTDSTPYRGDQITNWELSTARASAARRELETNGIDPSRVARVVGYADQELFLRDDPKNPRNRRISIILMQGKPGSKNESPKAPSDNEAVAISAASVSAPPR
jgi:chemotaxis protein MotB